MCFNEIFPDVNVDVMFVPALFFNSKGSFNNVCLFAKSFFYTFYSFKRKRSKVISCCWSTLGQKENSAIVARISEFRI